MKSLLFALILVFLSTNSLACMFPTSGEEFDSQIQIVKLDNDAKYKFIVPASINGLYDLEVTLGYSQKHEEGVKFMESSHKLNFNVLDNHAIGTFSIQKKINLKPYLHVMWWPERDGLCGVVASSELII